MHTGEKCVSIFQKCMYFWVGSLFLMTRKTTMSEKENTRHSHFTSQAISIVSSTMLTNLDNTMTSHNIVQWRLLKHQMEIKRVSNG